MNRRRGEGSSLKKYQENPEFLVSSAIQSFRSKKKRTIFVEGVNDKSFLHQWVSDGFRFDGFVGKPVIENLARYINRNHNASKYSSEFLLLADVDYDVTTCIGTVSGVNYFFVGDGGEHIYNDLDVFLFNSLALKKVLSNLRIDISSGGSTPEPQIFPSSQFQPGNQRIQVNNLIVALEDVMPVQQNMLPGHR